MSGRYTMRTALTVAGSDPGGGAGIQADLKTFHAQGVFGTTVVTAITAQDTVSVREASPLPAELVAAQLDAILGDFSVDAVKAGTLSSANIVETVAGALRRWGRGRLVVDPVIRSSSGHRLLDPQGVERLQALLLPLAALVTPNLDEAGVLSGIEIDGPDAMRESARRIAAFGCRGVLITGGHAPFDHATDLYYDGEAFEAFEARRVVDRPVHGTGCTLSAAITARLALGEELRDAVSNAKAYVTRVIEHAVDVGRGAAVGDHFYFLRGNTSER